MQRLKKVVAAWMVVVMMSVMSVGIFAGAYPSQNLHYVALGDSIAFGGSGEAGDQWVEDAYPDLLANYFKAGSKKLQYHNLSIPGIDSSDLLAMLRQSERSEKGSLAHEILKSDLITLSIGGNNLLGPLYFSKPEELQRDLLAGVSRFQQDWPKILKAIRKLNPSASIAVMTVYNPFQEIAGDPFGTNTLYGLGKTFLPMLNQTITEESLMKQYRYAAIEVYQAFENRQFSDHLTFMYDPANPDPHPTQAGQEEIFRLHANYFDTLKKQQ